MKVITTIIIILILYSCVNDNKIIFEKHKLETNDSLWRYYYHYNNESYNFEGYYNDYKIGDTIK